MQSFQQEKLQESNIHTVFLKAYELVDENKIEKIKDIETPLLLVERVKDFKENTFWMKIRDIWVLIGKIPPLTLETDDIVFFKESGKWGLFKYLEEKDELIILKDAKGERTTKIPKEVLSTLELFGKVLRVQEKV
ncbi:hypothetical protein [Hydrogenothermus marinus]|uniref:Uncharacterized protein n=1 Tax=Hydrogenothermus marinus TaxID=133270 RepID=A0A3M0B5D0_9AQUI|nr:hypothetical protein [Hydrogenothermus marinus]RMA92533.1 hypothetical protein CLV39_1581 [Hydrogenothermus marinus]